TVATGLTYLAMVRDGYTWSDHFENLGGGNPAASKMPDFVFASPIHGTALVESKGTRKRSCPSAPAFNPVLDTAYRDQVESHLGYTVGNATATHGYCIGAWMTSPTKAEMLVHHTEVPATGVGVGRGGDDSGSLTILQRHNYATAFHLALGQALGKQLRDGRIENVMPLFRFRWLDRSWLTGSPDLSPRFGDQASQLRFAIEESVATAVVQHFFQQQQPARVRGLDPLSSELSLRARNHAPQRGAVFPDGLALIDLGKPTSDMQRVTWSDGQFVAGNT
ncbi:MAG TPA: hypothetical protein VG742_08280, partial [Dongiaceae bacterium]|nr:hypothetical protein [Dongiaceae bacterium]